ncbi:Hypothetical predicted protein [Paramuricea clavata]|uniref:Uncharacterized protein n=1 Tax=Paramuricea clavata TaxID=317549 RepID=A0A6S7HAH8_PARCT|nr:Hypothetical predicted protein [Paramuricea clavata]
MRFVIGFTGLQIKPFQRLCKDNKSIESHNNGLKAPMKCSTPWQDKKFGYVPHAKTERAKFLNENVLPYFYKSQWKWSENARSLTQKFHSEGRRQYDLHVQLKKLQESLSSLIRKLSEDPLKPNDLKAIIYRIEQIEHPGEKVDKCNELIRQNDEKCFTKSGKIQSGYECSHSFNEKCYSDITSLKNKIVDALSRMHNRAKSRKRRLERQEEKCKRVFKLVTLSTVTCCYGDTA